VKGHPKTGLLQTAFCKNDDYASASTIPEFRGAGNIDTTPPSLRLRRFSNYISRFLAPKGVTVRQPGAVMPQLDELPVTWKRIGRTFTVRGCIFCPTTHL